MPDMLKTFAVLRPDLGLDLRDVTDDFYESLESDYDNFAGHVLVASHRFEADWPTWERHPAGDELVTLVSGRATFLLRTGSGDQAVELNNPGEFVVVPRGLWHTAQVNEPTVMLFITPGEGTENVEAPPIP